MAEIVFEVEGKVQAKQSARFAKIGNFMRSYQPKKVTNYAEHVRDSFLQSYPNHVPFEGLLWVSIEVYFIIPKSYTKKKLQIIEEQNYYAGIKPDCDNICKNLMDALNGVAFKDDRQIASLTVNKKYGDREYVKVSIMEM